MVCLRRVVLWLSLYVAAGLAYDIVRDYSGSSFFDRWDFYGNPDNLTNGNVYWVNENDAFADRLAYTNDFGRAVLRVDNTTLVGSGGLRNTVRITTQDTYAVGSLWVIDVVHIPWGCSVWPAFWSMGELWPDNGEIDIIEGINLMAANQMALHTLPGCSKGEVPNQLGTTGLTDCAVPAGCTVTETKGDSWGWGVNYGSTWVGGDAARGGEGGGVWATQFDVAGVYIWYFPRPEIPNSIKAATSNSGIDTSDWGNPSASYPSGSCNITQFFGDQRLVLDITLCGQWAGLPDAYLPQCASEGQTGNCYEDTVVGTGSRYNEAYFEINYLRAYTTGAAVPTPSGSAISQVTAAPTAFTIGAHLPTDSALTSLTRDPGFAPGNGEIAAFGTGMASAWMVALGVALGAWVVLL